jgi:hypothetical protein
MKPLFLSGLALAIAAGIALPLAGSAEAAIGSALPSAQILPVEKAQFFFNGQNYCWYDDGWQGPGWYWCGYAWNNGQGWGGAYGWNGWSRGSRGAYRTPTRVAPQGHFGHAPSVKIRSAPKFHVGNPGHGPASKSSTGPKKP